MKNKLFVVAATVALLILIITGTAFADSGKISFEIRKESDKAMSVKFVGNRMYHNDRYLGFGVSGRPMLSLRYMAEWFGYRVDHDPETGISLVGSGEYSFRLKPRSNQVDIYWDGEKVKEKELAEKPLLRNGALYLYSLDISDLLGLITVWDDSARTWDVLYREYTYKELGYPTEINDDLLTIKGLLYDAGTSTMPALEIRDTANKGHSYSGSISYIEPGIDSQNKYDMSSTIKMQEKNNRLQVSLTMGQRIIFAKNIEVAMNIEAKELVVNPPYQLTSPAKGYVKITQPEMFISGLVSDISNIYPSEVVLFVKRADNGEILLKESIPIVNGQFKHDLELKDEEGLYKITLNSIMAAPHGIAYPEITNFFVEYLKKANP